ncbi:hypothetical protein SAV14893_077880 [Streptomyces avermitilis]|uniref:Isochorismatase-like domain-containing protein n=1 Tax=Streptomyces avermitilis TaxID=33903 RepID=A0A4D4M973_STRAX|nr:hypothetical protein [Streptomyces avermitilis]GDY68395.1 hypothetical protein SAV14893_077880 [Streptomyces avermitilis]
MTTSALPEIDPQRTALLAMDFQNGIVAIAPEPDALVERVKGAIADVRAAGGTIGYVRVAFTEDDWAQVPETNKTFSAVAAAKMMHHEDDATQIDERIAPRTVTSSSARSASARAPPLISTSSCATAVSTP